MCRVVENGGGEGVIEIFSYIMLGFSLYFCFVLVLLLLHFLADWGIAKAFENLGAGIIKAVGAILKRKEG